MVSNHNKNAFSVSDRNRLLVPREVDRLLRYPRGRAARLARNGQLRHVVLPDGEIRFRREDIDRLLAGPPACLVPSRN